MFDSHIHTDISSDSDMKIDEVIDIIKTKNIGAILTEHMDLNYPDDNMFKLDIDEYIKSSNKYRADNLLIGIEIGFDDGIWLEKCKETANRNEFDFILGATHIVDGIDLYEDAFYKDTKTGEIYDIESVYNKYFDTMLKLVKKNTYFDSMAHIDYIARYSKRFYSDSEIHYDKYSNIIDKVLKEVVSMEKALEINTRRLGEKGAGENLIKIYKRFRELGGRFVTIGSDSHNKDSIALNFKYAREIAKDANLTPVYFKNRKMIIE